jgi:hypothetical protein
MHSRTPTEHVHFGTRPPPGPRLQVLLIDETLHTARFKFK